MTNGTLTLKRVLDLVTRYAHSEPKAGFDLVVHEEGARQEDDWWYVVVKPDRPGVRSYDYSDTLTRIEEKLREQEHVNVLLIPSIG